MRALIIYYTRTGNTTRIAQALAVALGAELAHADQVSNEQLQGREYIGIGSGVYWLRHDKRLFAVANRIPKGSKIFTFSTSGLKNWLCVAFYKFTMRFRLKRKGLNVIGQWHCPGHDLHPLIKPFGLNKGRPHATDIESAQAFVRQLCPMNEPIVAAPAPLGTLLGS